MEARSFRAQYPTSSDFHQKSATSVFIGGLSFDTDENDLKISFPGAIKCRIQRDRDTGKSKGFGFLDFVSVATAREVLREDGKDIRGRRVRLSEANAPPSSQSVSNSASSDFRRKSRSRSLQRNTVSGSTNREHKRIRMQDRLRLAAAGWDRKPTAEELKDQEKEAQAMRALNSKGEISSVRADLMKAASMKGSFH